MVAATFDVTNPATAETLRTLPCHTAEQVKEDVARARRAQKAWAALSVEARGKKLERVAEAIGRRTDAIARTVSDENGKVRGEALLHDVGPTLLVMNYFIEHAPRILAKETIRLAIAKHRKSHIAYVPKGVVGVITPWNFPFFMPGSDVAMALLAGNAVVLKPSEVTPLSALILKQCYDEAGIDPDLFRVVTGLGETGAALIEGGVDHVVFTGSVPTGRRVGVACAERMIPYTLELGGKAPAVVLEDADLDRTAGAILWGGFANAGQVCASVERVYATAPVYDELVRRVTDQAAKLKVGAPNGDSVVDIGAMTWAKQRDVVESLVADAREKGARVTTGGERVPGAGLFYRPTVIADCNHDMRVMKEETFGPVVPFMRVKDEAEAILLANESHLGLGAYVFTKDRERGTRVAEQLEVGSVMVNDVLTHAGSPEMPWGGIRQSGLGVVRSDRGLRELCHARHVNVDRVRPLERDPFWFPYGERQTNLTRRFVRSLYDGAASRLVRKLLT